MGNKGQFKLDRATTFLVYRGLMLFSGLLAIVFCFFFSGYFIQSNATIDTNGDVINAFGVSGSMGDTINGVMATVVGGAAVLTTFLAFVVQFQANQAQREDIKRERFETKFYEMLRLHRANVEEIEISGKHRGRKAFVKMFEEIQFIYAKLKSLPESSQFSPEKLIKISYHHLFWGVDHGKKVCNHQINKPYQELSEKLSPILAQGQSKYINDVILALKLSASLEYDYLHSKESVGKVLVLDYSPFEGYVSQLAHTYRHLFQMVKYVVSNDDLTWKEKYGYIKLLRAQLSNHEQVMMFFNVIWLSNDTWWEDEIDGKKHRYLLDYALLKNIPFNLTEQLGPDVIEYFSGKLKDGPYFIDPDQGDVTKEEKLKWLFEWS